MGDEEIGEVKFLLQIAHQVENLGLDRDVEGGGRLVGDHELGIEGERAGDADALALAAAKLVGITVDGIGGEADDLQELLDAGLLLGLGAPIEIDQRLADDAADGVTLVE